jgi:hypothetical protein
MVMKKILLQLDTDVQPSVFDAVTAYDGGADIVLQYCAITPENVVPLLHGVMFTRGGEGIKNSAVFIGGSDVAKGEVLLDTIKSNFFGKSRNSVMHDSNGCNTTAAAAVAKLSRTIDLRGRKAVVLAGTGPVGLRAALFLFDEGASVTVTSRRLKKAGKACEYLENRFGAKVEPAEAHDEDSTRKVLKGATVVLCTGTAGTMLLPEVIWKGHETLEALADLNAVPPYGIENIGARWDGENVGGQVLFGPLGIGKLKLKAQRTCVGRLFETNDLVLDAREIYKIVKKMQ